MITEASTDEDRDQVRDFLAQHIADIEERAVPRVDVDHLYRPTIPMIRGQDRAIRAAALACLPMEAVGIATAVHNGLRLPAAQTGRARVANRIRQLDLIAVRENERKAGLGAALVRYIEEAIRSDDVRVWFGCVTAESNVDQLRAFYTSTGFSITPTGTRLPPLLGHEWRTSLHDGEDVAFFFYKTLKRPPG